MIAIVERVEKEIEEMKDDIVEDLINSIRIPTENPPGERYNEMVSFYNRKLIAFDYSTEVVKLSEDELKKLVRLGKGDRPNLVGVIGRGKLKITFNGHYDVVPAGKGWRVDPFKGEIVNGKIYGRGSSDMKSGIISQIYAVEVLRRIIRLEESFTITQTIVCDEETVGNQNAGTYYLINKGFISRENTDYVVFTEPAGIWRILNGHRGALWGFIKVFGRKAHGGFPQLGIDAIRKANEILVKYYEEADKLKSIESNYKIIPEAGKNPSLLIGTLNCGDWMNTVADECTLSFVRRLIPEERIDDARGKILSVLKEKEEKDKGFRYDYTEHYAVDTIIENTNNELYNSFSLAIEEILGVKPEIGISAGTFDMRFTHFANIPSINYGPGKIELAHSTDEYVDIKDLLTSIKVISTALYVLGKKYGVIS
jgi:succinyl-diaminopimelate desuccinylase